MPGIRGAPDHWDHWDQQGQAVVAEGALTIRPSPSESRPMTLKVLVQKEPFTCLLEKTRVFFLHPESSVSRGLVFPPNFPKTTTGGAASSPTVQLDLNAIKASCKSRLTPTESGGWSLAPQSILFGCRKRSDDPTDVCGATTHGRRINKLAKAETRGQRSH